MKRILDAALIVALATGVAACSDEPAGPTPSQVGALTVLVRTTGVDLDVDGYEIVVGTGVRRQVAANASVVITGIMADTYLVALQGVAENCVLTDAQPRAATVIAGGMAQVVFEVECATIVTREQLVTRDLTLIWSDGSGRVELGDGFVGSHGHGFSPAWSPDGSRLVFSTTQCDTDWTTYFECLTGGLVIMNPETREVTVPPSGARGILPDWSPTGDRIVFVHFTPYGRRLFMMRLDGSAAEEIVIPGVREASWPDWSPDGRIAFGCRFIEGNMGICVMNSDGSGLVRLTAPEIEALAPDWSPDGRRIAFQVAIGGAPTVAIMNADGSGLRSIAEGFQPVWSRNGMQLGFSRDAFRTFTINADGSHLRQVTHGYGGGGAWRP